MYLTQRYASIPPSVFSGVHPLVLCNRAEGCSGKQPHSTSELWMNNLQQALAVPGIEQNELEFLSSDQRVPVFLNTGHTCDLAVKKKK